MITSWFKQLSRLDVQDDGYPADIFCGMVESEIGVRNGRSHVALVAKASKRAEAT